MWTGIFFDHVDLAGLPGVQINKLDPHSRAKLSVNRLSLAKADGQKLVNANYENKVIKIEGTIRGNSREQFEERYQNFFKYINTKEALLQIPQAGNMLNYIATADETSWTDDQVGTWGQFSVTFVASTPYGENPNYTTATNAVGITTAYRDWETDNDYRVGDCMNIDIYCDESRLELLEGNKNGYMIIGSLWLRREEREKLKNDIKALKQKYNFNVEIKWTKI